MRRCCTMRMIRSFLPVGQGAFYCEQFDGLLSNNKKVNIVYDCGSSTDVKWVEAEIRAIFDKDEIIHAVFISHLHNDHINGLKYLLKYCNVKNIFFPLMNEDEKNIVLVSNLINGVKKDSFVNLFVDNPRHALDSIDLGESRPMLFPIIPYGEEVRYDVSNQLRAKPIYSGENVNGVIERTKIGLLKDWCYIPFNFKNKERTELLKEKLEIAFGFEFEGLRNLQNLWNENNDNKKKIKKAYQEIDGDHNTNSMTLFSGPIQHGGYQVAQPNNFCRHYCKYCIKPSGCLYTGDYDASKKQQFEDLKDMYLKQWNQIGCLQIPHHGSSHNYNSCFSTLNSFFVISVGRSNKYRHPHSKVIKNLMFNNRYPFIVTEDCGSAVHLVVNY